MYNLERWHCFWMIYLKSGKSHLINKSFHKIYDKLFFFFKYFFSAFSASKCKEEKLFGREKFFMQATRNKYFVLRKSYCGFMFGARYIFFSIICMVKNMHYILIFVIKKISKISKSILMIWLIWPGQIKYMGLHEVY